MLILVDLFEFKVIVALVLRVATHERMGGFTQVVFEETVARADEAGIVSFKHTGLVLRPGKAGKFSKSGLSIKTVDIADFGDDTSGKYGADTRNRSQCVGDVVKLALNFFI